MFYQLIHILIIEDSAPEARLFREMLALDIRSTYSLHHTETLAESFEYLGQHQPDLIVLDLSLPDADHLEALTALIERAPEIPTVVHSGLSEGYLLEEALQRGAQDYLVKGNYDAALLGRVIHYAIERQRALRRLKENELQLRAIINQTSDGILIVRKSGHITFANRAAARLFDTTVEALVGTSFGFPLVAGEVAEVDIPGRHSASSTLEMQVSTVQWKGESAFLAALHDITARKQFEDRLVVAKEKAEEIAQAKSSYLAQMSHDLRSPLMGILGFAEVLEQTQQQDIQEFASIIKKASSGLLETVDSVLELSRLESGTVTVKHEPVDLAALLKEVVTVMAPTAREKGLTLRLSAAAGIMAWGEKVHLHRIIQNLIDNAIKYTQQGHIHVSLKPHKGKVKLSVKDTGIGIPGAFLPQLFDEYSQERPFQQGNGLGLAVTKRLVSLLNGTIEVESKVGKGSTFTVLLPRAPSPGRSATPPTRTSHPGASYDANRRADVPANGARVA